MLSESSFTLPHVFHLILRTKLKESQPFVEDSTNVESEIENHQTGSVH